MNSIMEIEVEETGGGKGADRELKRGVERLC